MRISGWIILCSLLVSGASVAYTQPYPDQLVTVGKARLSFLWFDIYDAELMNKRGQFQALKGPLLLKIRYLRDISQQELIAETDKQWNRQQVAQELRDQWLARLDQIYPDIRSNDSLAFYMDDLGSGYFYLNQRFIGAIENPDFSRAFLNIWLAENSHYPSLTRQLTGEIQ